jgi:hypothetical protein
MVPRQKGICWRRKEGNILETARALGKAHCLIVAGSRHDGEVFTNTVVL